MWTFGVFLKPMIQDLRWSRAQVSSGYMAFLLGYVISVITTGRLADKYSPKPILLVSAILTGLGFSLCSQVHTVNHLRMLLFIGGLGGGANWSVPTATVQRWFFARSRAGLALGITISGVGVGALIFALLADYLVSGRGWRDAYLTVGIIFFAIMAASAFVVKKAPVDTRALPNGSGKTPNKPEVRRRERRQNLMSLPFAGITICHCMVVVAFQTIAAHLVPYATDIGIPSTASAAAMGLMGGILNPRPHHWRPPLRKNPVAKDPGLLPRWDGAIHAVAFVPPGPMDALLLRPFLWSMPRKQSLRLSWYPGGFLRHGFIGGTNRDHHGSRHVYRSLCPVPCGIPL
jgi:MFS family permease